MSDANPHDSDPWLTPDQVGQELNTHPATVRLWLRDGRLEATKTASGHKWLVRRSEVDRMLAEMTRSPRLRSRVQGRGGDPYAPRASGPGEGVLDTISDS